MIHATSVYNSSSGHQPIHQQSWWSIPTNGCSFITFLWMTNTKKGPTDWRSSQLQEGPPPNQQSTMEQLQNLKVDDSCWPFVFGPFILVILISGWFSVMPWHENEIGLCNNQLLVGHQIWNWCVLCFQCHWWGIVSFVFIVWEWPWHQTITFCDCEVLFWFLWEVPFNPSSLRWLKILFNELILGSSQL